MKLHFVLLCESVVTATDGRNSYINVMDTVQATTFPSVIPKMAICARFVGLEEGKRLFFRFTSETPWQEEVVLHELSGISQLAIHANLNMNSFEVKSSGRVRFKLYVKLEDEAWQLAGETDLMVLKLDKSMTSSPHHLPQA